MNQGAYELSVSNGHSEAIPAWFSTVRLPESIFSINVRMFPMGVNLRRNESLNSVSVLVRLFVAVLKHPEQKHLEEE